MNRILSPASVTLFLAGDIMTGRGIDQILPHSASPRLYEPYLRDARDYVELAEQVSGPIPRRVDAGYVWGDALEEFRRREPQAKIVNLETSITAGGEPWPGKGIHYRMHPGNAPLLTAAGIDVCTLANNHVLDWGYEGLADTLETLRKAGVRTAGAGNDVIGAEAPAAVEIAENGRVLVFSYGASSSGIPGDWAGATGRPGVNLLPELSAKVAGQIGVTVRKVKRPGDLTVASIHWGGNWGYDISPVHRRFAHLLLDEAGIDLVHGHSSHHPKGIEVHRGKLILYGCGDLVTDYEGIGGYEAFRGELGLLYFVRIDRKTGMLAGLEMAPMRMRRFRLVRTTRRDAAWLRDTLNREGKRLGTRLEMKKDGTLILRWENG